MYNTVVNRVLHLSDEQNIGKANAFFLSFSSRPSSHFMSLREVCERKTVPRIYDDTQR